MSKNRQEQLKQWIAAVLDIAPPKLSAVSGDASFRRYFRFTQQGQSIIAVDAPPEHENNLAFWQIGSLISSQKVRVPEFLHINLEDGFILLSDLGDRTLLPELNENTVDDFYRKAIDMIILLQKTPIEKIGDLPRYDQQKLSLELSLFETWFVDKHLGIQLNSQQTSILDDLFKRLIARAEKQTQRFTHRDFHSRNLMIMDQNELAVIDFQDAVIGPVSYDLVSLIKDCYIHWPEKDLDKWIEYFYQKSNINHSNQMTFTPDSLEEFRKDLDWMGLQRHLKVLGIFCRLNYRDGKSGYLEDLPLTYEYVKDVSQKYEEFEAFDKLMNEVIGPEFEAKR